MLTIFLADLPAALRRLPRNLGGATAVEYALIASLVAMAILTSLGTLSGGIRALFDSIAKAFTG